MRGVLTLVRYCMDQLHVQWTQYVIYFYLNFNLQLLVLFSIANIKNSFKAEVHPKNYLYTIRSSILLTSTVCWYFFFRCTYPVIVLFTRLLGSHCPGE